MRIQAILLLSVVVAPLVGADASMALECGFPRTAWVAWQKTDRPKWFAEDFGWIDSRDGVDEKEAFAIARLYFKSSGNLCGAIGKVTQDGDHWSCVCALGYAADHINPILVDAKTGAVWQDGGERIDDIMAFLATPPAKEGDDEVGRIKI